MLHVTLNSLKRAHACEPRYRHLVAALGGVSFGRNELIPLARVIELNGIEDAVWALCATIENSDRIARLFACACAERVLPLFESERPGDMRPRTAIETARKCANGEATAEEMAAAWAAASAAARDAAWTAARDAARDAAWDAAWDAARSEQEKILRDLLDGTGITLREERLA